MNGKRLKDKEKGRNWGDIIVGIGGLDLDLGSLKFLKFC